MESKGLVLPLLLLIIPLGSQNQHKSKRCSIINGPIWIESFCFYMSKSILPSLSFAESLYCFFYKIIYKVEFKLFHTLTLNNRISGHNRDGINNFTTLIMLIVCWTNIPVHVQLYFFHLLTICYQASP